MTNNTANETSKYQTWQPWIAEYTRLTTHGYSHTRAAQLADALIETKLATMRRALAAK